MSAGSAVCTECWRGGTRLWRTSRVASRGKRESVPDYGHRRRRAHPDLSSRRGGSQHTAFQQEAGRGDKLALRLSAHWLAVDLLQAENISLEPGKCGLNSSARTSSGTCALGGRSKLSKLNVAIRMALIWIFREVGRLTSSRPSAFFDFIARWLDV